MNDKAHRISAAKTCLSISVAAAALALPSQAFAQDTAITKSAAVGMVAEHDPSDKLGDIVVTATKRSERLVDVPISITAFSTEAIEKAGIARVQDYAALAPNVGFSSDGSPTSATVVIRGVGDLGGNVNSVVTYIDEISVTPAVPTGASGLGTSANDVNLTDIERIEVLRGPQGVNFGRSALGGAVNITTLKPGSSLAGTVEAEYGSFSTGLVRGSVNVPLETNLYARVQAYHIFSGGFLINKGPSEDTNDYRGYGGALALRYAGERLTVDLRGAYRQYRQGLDSSVGTGVLNPVLFDFGYLNPINEGQGFYPSNRRIVSTNSKSEAQVESTFLSGRAEYDLGSVSAVFLGGYLTGRNQMQRDSDGTSFDAYSESNLVNYESVTLESRLQSSGDGPLSWNLGVNYSRDSGDNLQVRTVGRDFGPIFFGAPAGFLTGSTIQNEYVRQKLEGYAGFADVRLKLMDGRLALGLGVRYAHDEFNGQGTDIADFSADPGTQPAVRATSEALTPRATILFKATPNINLYATISRGYKPAGATLTALAINPNTGLKFAAPYGKETLWNYEAGIKGGAFDKRLSFSLTAFYMKWNDIQVANGYFDSVTLSPASVIQNAANAVSKGIELELTARPVPALTLGAAVGYNDAKFSKYTDAALYDSSTGRIFIGDASGRPLPFAPLWSASANAEFRQPIGVGKEIFLRGEWSSKSKQARFSNANPNRQVDYNPQYDVVNAQIGFETPTYRMAIFIENVFDTNYTLGFNPTQYLNGATAQTNVRTFGIRFRGKFN